MDCMIIRYCRLCAAVMTKDDFLTNLQLDARRMNDVTMKLNRINASVDFTDSIIAKTICLLCSETLDKSFNFVTTVEAAQSTLNALFSSTTLNTDDVSDNGESDRETLETDDVAKNCGSIQEETVDCKDSLEKLEQLTEEDVGIKVKVEDGENFENELPEESEQENDSECLNLELNNVEKLDPVQPSERLEDYAFKKDKEEFQNADASTDVNESPILVSNCKEIDSESSKPVKRVYKVKAYSKFSKIEYKANKAVTISSNPEKIEHLPEKHVKIHSSGDIPIYESDNEQDVWKKFTWICKLCGTQFPTIDELKNHSITYHKCCNAFRCPYCNTIRFKLHPFMKHVKRHRPKLRTSCYLCFRKFETPMTLWSHVMKQHKDTRHVCIGCHTTFSSASELNNHTSTYYKSYEKSITHFTDYGDLKSFKCLKCDKQCTSRASLSAHYSKVHSHQKHICDVCGKVFAAISALKTHIEVNHNKDKNKSFQCDYCKAFFASKSAVSQHIGRHSSRSKFVCDKCGRNFTSTYHLKRHYKVHSKELPFSCTVCSKAFAHKSYLKTHMYQHTGERPFKCKMCPLTFTNSGNCHKHMKRRHGKANKSPMLKLSF